MTQREQGVFEEGRLRFQFDRSWYIVNYDRHQDYLDSIHKLQNTKAIDFVGLQENSLFFIEVTDYRGSPGDFRDHSRSGRLAIELAHKVRDSIVGIVAAHHRGKTEEWGAIVEQLATPEPPIKVVLWLERDDAPRRPGSRRPGELSVLKDQLKQQLAWLTRRVDVDSLSSKRKALTGVDVSNLPGAGRLGELAD